MVDFSKISINDLLNCGWQEIIKSCDDNTNDFCSSFSKAAKVASAQGDARKAHALNLLFNICSLQLKSSNPKSPFEPMGIEKSGNTSTKYSDFSKENCKLIQGFAEQINNSELLARLYDLTWCVTHDYHLAKKAIKNYIASSDSTYCKNHWQARMNRLERALRLSTSIKDESSIDTIKNSLIDCLNRSQEKFEYLATRTVGEILLEFNLLDSAVLGDKLLELGLEFPGDEEFKHDLFLVAASAFDSSDNKTKSNQAKILAAEALEKKANAIKQPGSMIAASDWLRQAISAFQQCKGQGDRVEALQKELILVNRECTNEMQEFSVEIDITDMKRKAIAVMQDKNIFEALLHFGCLSCPIPRKKLEERALEKANDTFASTASKSIFNGDGRLVALIPPLLGSKGDDYELALRYASYEQATYEQKYLVNGLIIPARNELLKQHQINRESLRRLLNDCSFFPTERLELWLKGFEYGFYSEFDAALCILIPQFEHALRKQLEFRKALVWRIDPATNTHSEKSLNELFKMKEIDDCLDKDWKFTLQGLLIEPISHNFRNQSAHGLMNESSYCSPSAIYLWWLLFHLVVRWLVSEKI